jgi:hypothetical protein
MSMALPAGKNFPWTDRMVDKAKRTPVMYRVRINKREGLRSVFQPARQHSAGRHLQPDRGYRLPQVGSRWPLARGKTTGSTIDDRFFVSPAHNSVELGRQPARDDLHRLLRSIDSLGALSRWWSGVGPIDWDDRRHRPSVAGLSQELYATASLELRGAQQDFDAMCRAPGLPASRRSEIPSR